MQTGRAIAFASMIAAPAAAQGVPGVDVWIPTPTGMLSQGTPVSARVVADPKAYVVVFRVTTDHHIIVVSPRTPYGAYRVPTNGLRSEGLDASFQADSVNGVGRLFAAASYTSFDFSRVRSGGSWDITKLGVPPDSNPTDVADWFVRQIIPSSETPYGENDVAYYVGVAPPATSQDAFQSAQQNGSQNTMADTPDHDAWYGYGYDPYAWGTLPYAGWYGNPYDWYAPAPIIVPGAVSSQYCPNGLVVPINTLCPIVPIATGRPGSRFTPRRPPPPHPLPQRMHWKDASPATPDQAPPPATQHARPAVRKPAPLPAAPPARSGNVSPHNR